MKNNSKFSLLNRIKKSCSPKKNNGVILNLSEENNIWNKAALELATQKRIESGDLPLVRQNGKEVEKSGAKINISKSTNSWNKDALKDKNIIFNTDNNT